MISDPALDAMTPEELTTELHSRLLRLKTEVMDKDTRHDLLREINQLRSRIGFV